MEVTSPTSKSMLFLDLREEEIPLTLLPRLKRDAEKGEWVRIASSPYLLLTLTARSVNAGDNKQNNRQKPSHQRWKTNPTPLEIAELLEIDATKILTVRLDNDGNRVRITTREMGIPPTTHFRTEEWDLRVYVTQLKSHRSLVFAHLHEEEGLEADTELALFLVSRQFNIDKTSDKVKTSRGSMWIPTARGEAKNVTGIWITSQDKLTRTDSPITFKFQDQAIATLYLPWESPTKPRSKTNRASPRTLLSLSPTTDLQASSSGATHHEPVANNSPNVIVADRDSEVPIESPNSELSARSRSTNFLSKIMPSNASHDIDQTLETLATSSIIGPTDTSTMQDLSESQDSCEDQLSAHDELPGSPTPPDEPVINSQAPKPSSDTSRKLLTSSTSTKKVSETETPASTAPRRSTRASSQPPLPKGQRTLGFKNQPPSASPSFTPTPPAPNLRK